MNKLRKTLLILFATMTAVFAPSAMNAQTEGNWIDYRDTEWGSDYSQTSFTINTPGQLAQLAYLVNNGRTFEGKTVTLNDAQVTEEYPWGGSQTYTYPYYDLNEHYWTPIGTANYPFKGIFNGNGKSITYVKITGSDSYQGFFGYIGTGGKVQSLVFDYGSNISGSTQVGCLAGCNGGTVENCLVLNATVSGTGYVGNIIGQNAGTVTNCYCINCGATLALGDEGSTTGVDSDGHAQCLYNIKADGNTISSENDFTASVGSTTGVQVGNGVFYTDGIQYNLYHYYKTGATATLTYNVPGYDVTFSVSGTGASIDDDNVVTVGTEKVTVSIASKVPAEWSGSGDSAGDPYIIYTREQFDMLAERVNDGTSDYNDKFFRLENDVDYDGITYYVAVGTSEHPFAGTFDGNGHSIEGPQISLAGTSYQGVFGYNNGTIKNLKVTNPYILGGDFSGGIAGYNAGVIENCRVDYERGVFYGEDGHHSYGGIAGYNRGYISYCVSAATVDSYTNLSFTVSKVGGIVGHNSNGGNVEYCLYLGRLVDGTEYVGAIAGMNEGTLSSNLYHHNGYQTYSNDNIGTTVLGVGTQGSLTGPDVQGAAAKAKVVKLPEGGTFSQPYGATVSGSPTYETTNSPNGMPLSVYSDGILFRDTYFASSNEIGTAFYTTANTINLIAIDVPDGFVATFYTESDGASFDGNTLTMDENADVIEVSVSAGRVPTGWLAEGTRAESFSNADENSITIMSAKELALLAYNVNFANETYSDYTITLGDDINLSGNTWEPIGLISSGGGMGGYPGMGGEASGFLGVFDGSNYTISNMNSGNYGAGLFATVSSTVQNLTIENATVCGTSMVGIVAGMCSGTIQNCRVVGSNVSFATSEEDYNRYLGGLVGNCQGGTITGCSVDSTTINANVSGERIVYIGGIVGMLSGSEFGATLTNNIFSGTITLGTGAEYFGAIAGISQDYSQYGGGSNTIANNYYTTGNIGGINNADVTENDGAVFAVIREIEGYGSGNDKWAFIASPVAGNVTPGNVHNLLGQMITESPMLYDFDLYRLNPSTTMWENYNNSEHTTGFNLVNGHGYLYATKETKTLVFAGDFNTGDSKTVGLSEGFNLVGNPFIVEAYVNGPYYKMNEGGTAIEPVTDNAAIAPCTGVVVEAESTGNVTFTKSPASETTLNNGFLNITVAPANLRASAGSAAIDKAIVSFNKGNQLGKFYFGTQAANLYIPQGTEEYAIANTEAQGEMPVNFKANQDGQYTITVNPEGVEMSYLHLVDNMTGADVDLLALRQAQGLASYTFTAKTTDYESRFRVVFSISEDANGDNDSFAFISNGEIRLLVETLPETSLQMVDMMGRVVVSVGDVSGDVSGNVSTNGIPTGVYVLRLINGNNVKTQKIVVK